MTGAIIYNSQVHTILLTYSIYFSYAVCLTDSKKIFEIAGEVKQLTVPLLPDPNCSIPENDALCVIPVTGFVVMCMYIR